jgi:hypothetical protein
MRSSLEEVEGPLLDLGAIETSPADPDISGRSGSPGQAVGLVDIRVSDATRSGWSSATSWPIHPPTDIPTKWALSRPKASSRPTASCARSRRE